MAIRFLPLPPSAGTAIAIKPGLRVEERTSLKPLRWIIVYRKLLQLQLVSLRSFHVLDRYILRPRFNEKRATVPSSPRTCCFGDYYTTARRIHSALVGVTSTNLWRDHNLMDKFILLKANYPLHINRHSTMSEGWKILQSSLSPFRIGSNGGKLCFFFSEERSMGNPAILPTDGRGGKPLAIADGLTPKDSRLEPVTSPQTERVCTRLTN